MIRLPESNSREISKRIDRWGIFLFALMMSCVVMMAGCQMAKTKAETSSQPKAKTVEVISPRKGSIQPAVSFTGTIVPVNEADIYSKLPGRVKEVAVKEGDSVTGGQLLIQLEDEEMRAQVRQLEANLSSARVQLSKAMTGYGLQSTQVDIGIDQSAQSKAQAELSADQARLNMEDAATDLMRMQRLFERGAIAKDQLEGAELRYNTTKKQYEASLSLIKQANESLKLAKANTAMTSLRRDDIALAQAQIDSLTAALDLARTNLENCRILAPFAGVITLKTAEKGEVVMAAPTGTPLLRIVDNGTVNLEGEIGESRIEDVRPGGRVELSVDALPGKTFRGLVATIIPAVDQKTKAFRIKVAIPNRMGELNGGMFARANILLPPSTGLVLPRPCLVQGTGEEPVKVEEDKNNPKPVPSVRAGKDQFYVFVQEGDRAKKVAVTMGAFNEKEAVVTAGITARNRIISVGQETLSDNESITVVRGN